jgi:hypothetical protein
MKVKDLPKPIRKLAKRNVQKQKGFLQSVTCENLTLTNAFTWSQSIEGYEYWYQVDNRNFDFEPRKEVKV